jgi:Carboxypeptidase regulatory-like domain
MNRPGIPLPGCNSRHRSAQPTLRHMACLLLCLCGLLHSAFAQKPSSPDANLPNSPTAQTPGQPPAGRITGFVTDEDGASIPGATVSLSLKDQPANDERQAVTNSDGSFSFTNVAPGSFQLTLSAPGFSTQQKSGSLQPGEQAEIPQISLPAATLINFDVNASKQDIAQEQIRLEEKQRVFGVIPNFYVSYIPNPVSLTAKQKFELAWKVSIDPVNFAITGVVAGVQQSQNTFGGYGEGAQGYAKRYGAAYADGFIGTMIGSAILPSVLKQDPRYFYKGTGSITARAFYAIANSVICKGDNGHWQPNYSNIIGNFASGAISNLYYPHADRGGAELTVETGLIGIAAGAGANLFQEFLLRKITPHTHQNLPTTHR